MMNGREIIKDIMSRFNITNATLANRLGITPAALWDRIDTQPRKGKPRKDIPVSLLSEMVQVMDYKVVVIPSTARVPKDGYVIGEGNNSSEIDLDTLLSDTEEQVDEPILTPTEESKETKKTGKKIKLVSILRKVSSNECILRELIRKNRLSTTLTT